MEFNNKSSKRLTVLSCLLFCVGPLFAQSDTSRVFLKNALTLNTSVPLQQVSIWHAFTINYERVTKVKNLSLDVALGYFGKEKFNLKAGVAYSIHNWAITPVGRLGVHPYFDFTPSPKSKRSAVLEGQSLGYPISFPFESKVYALVGMRFKMFNRRFIAEMNGGYNYGFNYGEAAVYRYVPNVNLMLGYAF